MGDGAAPNVLEELRQLRREVELLKDVNAVRTLHFKYGYYIDMCLYDEAVELFSDQAVVYFLNGIYRGRKGASRLYKDWFRNMFTKGVNGPIYGFLLDHFISQDIVDIAPDGLTAKGRFRCLMQAGYHETKPEPVHPLPPQCWEGGIHENTYVKEGGVWKILELNYNMLWQANYEEGWAHSGVHLEPFAATWPENPIGPDDLRDYVPNTWPNTRVVPFHYPHPVTGEPWRGANEAQTVPAGS